MSLPLSPKLEIIPAMEWQLMKVWRSAFTGLRVPWHYHPEVELVLIHHGKGVVQAGRAVECYEPGTLFFFGSCLPHCQVSFPIPSAAKTELTVFQFRPLFWEKEFGELHELKSLGLLLKEATCGFVVEGPGRKKVAKLMTRIEALPPFSWRRVSLCLEMLGTIAENAQLRPLNSGSHHLRVPTHADAVLQTALQYAHENSTEEIVHAEVARRVHLSPAAFCRFFKRHMAGKTFSEYVNEIRLMRACHDLLDTDQSITDIAYACGYNNLPYFNRRFKAFLHCTPREYRVLFAGENQGTLHEEDELPSRPQAFPPQILNRVSQKRSRLPQGRSSPKRSLRDMRKNG